MTRLLTFHWKIFAHLAEDSFNAFCSFGALQRIRGHTEPVSSNSPEGHLRGANHVANRVRTLRGLLPFKT